jgi:hypothetical protein
MPGSRLLGLVGIATMLLLAVLLSYNRRHINWRVTAGRPARLARQGRLTEGRSA